MFRELPPRGPDGPRALTHQMIVDARHPGRFLRVFGAIWGGVSLMVGLLFGVLTSAGGIPNGGIVLGGGILFGALGLGAYLLGRRAQRRALHLFRHGDEARGEVVDVRLDTMQRVNQQHPWKVRYRFDCDGEVLEGCSTYWTTDPPEGLDAGREIVVLYDPDDPDHNLLWAAATPPRLEPIAGGDERGQGVEDREDGVDGAGRVRIVESHWREGPYALAAGLGEGGAARGPAREGEPEAEAEAEADAVEEARRRRSTRR